EKDAVPVNGVIAVVGEKGENIDNLLKEINQGGGSDAGDTASSESQEADQATKESKTAEPSKDEGDSSKEIDTSGIKATLITMPKMSDTMQEGTISAWLKKVGDEIKSGDILAEVETDKATMELESYADGILLHIGVNEGDSVEIDGVIAVIGEKDADYQTLLKAHQAKTSGSTETAQPKEGKKEAVPAEKTDAAAASKKGGTSKLDETGTGNGYVNTFPSANEWKKKKGVDISLIKGTD